MCKRRLYSFITFAKCEHLDGKHSVFGRVVGGMQTLDLLEMLSTGPEDRPLKDIVLQDAQVFVNPFRDVIQELLKKENKKRKKAEEEAKINVSGWWGIASSRTRGGSWNGDSKTTQAWWASIWPPGSRSLRLRWGRGR